MNRWLKAPLLAAALASSTAQAQYVCTSCQTVAIADIESDTNCNLYANDWGTLVVLQCQRKFREIRDMVETALRGTNKYAIFERARLYTLFDERALAMAGTVNGRAYRSRLTGVDYLVYGKVTEFSRGSRSVSTRGYGESADDAAMAIDLKIVNVRSGMVIFAGDVRETLETASIYEGETVSTQTSMDPARVAGLLQRAVARAIARDIAFKGFPLTVVATQGSNITVNYGSPFLEKCLLLDAFKLGPPMIDPTTGAVIGRERTEAGRFEVRQVTPSFATAVRISGTGPMPLRSDVVDIVSPDEAYGCRGAIPDM